jgi:hypothetical protein
MQTKENFVKLCELIFVGKNGYNFPFDAIRHYENYQEIYKSEEYSLLEKKMKNLINLVNSDNSLTEKDIEEELWYMI